VTVTDLQQLLESGANGLEEVKSLLSPTVDDQILTILHELQNPVVLPLIQPFMPGIDLTADIAKAVQIMTTIKRIVSDGSVDKWVRMFRGMEHRVFLLRVIAQFV